MALGGKTGAGISVNFTADFSGMARAMDMVARESRRTNAEVVTLNAREFMRQIVFATPGPPQGHQVKTPRGKSFFKKNTGTGRAGWTPAWLGLGIKGRPYTPRAFGQQPGKMSRYKADGSFEDQRQKLIGPYIVAKNTTSTEQPARGNRKAGRFLYLYKSNRKGPNKGWFQRGVDKTQFSFAKMHAKLMRKYSAK